MDANAESDQSITKPQTPAELSHRRKQLQLPLFVLATVGLIGSGYVIAQKIKARSPAHYASGVGSTTAFRHPTQPDFDTSNATIPVNEIRRGGPPKDGIPALTNPKFVIAQQATFLQPGDRVIGVSLGNEAKAYPLKILDSHEAVNDRVGGVPLSVTYCPLCDSSAVFDCRLGDREIELGISGLLYNSNVLLYDRTANPGESLWSQMQSGAVAGPAVGQSLRKLPCEVTTWADWQTRYPHTLVLSTETGHQRRYDQRGYQQYFNSDRLMFPVTHLDERLPKKTPVLGVSVGNQYRAYPVMAMREPQRLVQTLGEKEFVLQFNPASQSLRVESAEEGVQWMYSFWFAWAAFHSETELWQPSG